VTKRSVDIGALINAGSQSSESPLFNVADVHQMRVYVSVPQNDAAEIQPGLGATLTLPEYPGRVFKASLDTTSHAISDASDTLLVELLADNLGGVMTPGEYAQVTLHLPAARGALRLPASALIFRQQGLQVATVLPNRTVLMKNIRIGRDLGTEVEVSDGLSAQDHVVDNPPDSIRTGDHVHVVPAGHN
jgi:RND family efflux transporter MFP subunit